MSSPGARVSYFHDESIAVYASVEASILKPHILKLTHELIKAYGLPQHMRMCLSGAKWQPATESDFSFFHVDDYLQFLQQLATNGSAVVDEAVSFVLNQSVCFTETAWEYASSYTGGSLAASQSLMSGESDIAICWMGGQTHARRDCASGFSYVNDVVLAILSLLRSPEDPERRVMFVNFDAWHCSGVEEAFYTTDRVLCISLHRYRDGFFPGSGGKADCGEGVGKNHNINLPVAEGLTDSDVTELLLPVLVAAAERFCPHAIVCCAGAGVIAGDRLGCLNVSLDGHAACLKALKALDVPLLVLGGGGYTQLNAARTWCNATATLCDVTIPDQLPEHSLLDYYTPDYTMSVPLATMSNANSSASLEETRERALKTIAAMPQRVKPLKPKRPVIEQPAADAQPPTDAVGSAAGDAASAGPVIGGGVAGDGASVAPANGTHDASDVMASSQPPGLETEPGPMAAASSGGASSDAMDVEQDTEATGATAGAGEAEDAMEADEPAIGDND